MSIVRTSRSAHLIEACREHLDRSMTARFVNEARTGTLSNEHFARYLAIEEGFVQTAVRVHAYSLYKEPDWAVVTQHAASIGDLLGEQLDYFERTRAQYGDSAINIRRAVKNSEGLSRYVLEVIESHGYAGAIVSMFAAETLYSQWCATTAAERTLNQHDGVDAWIALHATPAFAQQAAKLASMVDRLPAQINRSSRDGGASDAQLAAWFTGMLASEDTFHDSIYFDGE